MSTPQEPRTQYSPQTRDYVPERTRVGIYDIREELGRGGMGVVYLARRKDSFDMSVALKVLKRGMDTDEIVRRFQRERQILADLKHPNIASILDGGTTSDGLPYLVMEYVKGSHLTEYMDHHCLNINDRLRLFLEVCDTVSFAHQNLVIHQDLKPANILVEKYGRHKLLDFGIAAIMSPESGEAVTRLEKKPFTPEYAAPEQVQGRRLTPSCDTYALGVMLFELLTGKRPYSLEGKDTFQCLQIICQREIHKPSTALGRPAIPFYKVDGERPGEHRAAELRGSDPERLKRKLTGDLDSIAVKALARNPRNRYPSVEQLTDDIRRYLEEEPVHARKATRYYVIRKFTWRNRYKLIFSSIFLMIVLMFVGALGRQLRIAEREQKRANQVTEFLTGVFLEFDPEEGRGALIKAEDFLGMGVDRLESEFKDDPLLRSGIMITIGRTYLNLGEMKKAERLFRDAMEMRKKLLPYNHPGIGEIIHFQGVLETRKGNYTLAAEYLEQALDIKKAALGSSHSETILSKASLARVYLSMKYFDRAEMLLTDLVRLDARGEANRDLVDTFHILADTTAAAARTEKARGLYQYALRLASSVHGDRHPKTGAILTRYALVLHDLGQYEEAARASERAVDIMVARYGPEHAEVAQAITNMAALKRFKGQWEEVEMLCSHVVEINRNSLGSSHINTAKTLNNLGMVFNKRGNHVEALEAYGEVLAVYYQKDPLPWFSIAITTSNQGSVMEALGNHHKAHELYSEALSNMQQSMGPAYFANGIILGKMGRNLEQAGKHAEAETYARQALYVMLAASGAKHPRTAEGALYLSEILVSLDCREEAEELMSWLDGALNPDLADRKERLMSRLRNADKG